MGQKIHPGGMRVGVIHDWKSNWYASTKEFPQALLEDLKIREHIYNKLSHAGLSDILIRKDKQRITVDIFTARPGIVIGKSGAEVDALRKELHAKTQKNVHININEIKRPELDAKLVAQSIAEQLENRVSFRRAMKRSLASAIRSGAQGVKIQCGGRLGGAEMSRSESYSEGREQPPIEPQVETTPDPVADAPDTTTTKKQTEDPTKLEKAGDEAES
jgi:small subunit ribosomal protein S3